MYPLRIFSLIWWATFSFCWFPSLCKNFNLMQSYCLFLLLLFLPEETYPKNITKTDVKRGYYLCFLLGVLCFQALTFFVFNPFWICFCMWCDRVVQFHFSACSIQFSQHRLLKRLSFLHCTFFPYCHKLIDHVSMGLFLGPLFCFTDLYIYFCASARLFRLL